MSENTLTPYQQAVEANTVGMRYLSTGACPGCNECASDFGMELEEFTAAWEAGEIVDEPGFSWSGCDICGSHLGGDREVYHWVDDQNEIQHGWGACIDCVLYLANGDLPEHWEE